MRDNVLRNQLDSAKETITRLTDELKKVEDGILAFYQVKKDMVASGSYNDRAFRPAELTFFTLAERILTRRMGRAVAPEHVELDPTVIGHPAPRRRRAPRSTQATPVPRPPRRTRIMDSPAITHATPPRPRRSVDMSVAPDVQAYQYITPNGEWVPAEQETIPELNVELVSSPIVAHNRRLEGRWTVDTPAEVSAASSATVEALDHALVELREATARRENAEMELARQREMTRSLERTAERLLSTHPTYTAAATPSPRPRRRRARV